LDLLRIEWRALSFTFCSSSVWFWLPSISSGRDERALGDAIVFVPYRRVTAYETSQGMSADRRFS